MYGVIGLGQMGGSIARRLAQQGLPLMVFDISPRAVEALRTDGGAVQAAGSPAEIGRRCDTILVVVLNDEQVTEVVAGADGILAGFAQRERSDSDSAAGPATVALIHSTVQPDTVAELGAACERSGGSGNARLGLLDAPVTGGPAAVEAGDLAVMLGGPAELCDVAAPRLAAYAGLALRMGHWGAGQRAKIARNLITYAEWLVGAEATALARAAEVDVDQLWKIIDHSDRHIGVHGGYSGLRVLMRDADAETGAAVKDPLVGLARKDLQLASDLAQAVGRDPWLSDRAAEQMDEVLDRNSDAAADSDAAANSAPPATD